jgi:hypothetical protein
LAVAIFRKTDWCAADAFDIGESQLMINGAQPMASYTDSGPVIIASFQGLELCSPGEERWPFLERLGLEPQFFSGRWRQKRATDLFRRQ